MVYQDSLFSTILDSLQSTITSNDGSYTVKGDIKSKYIKVVVRGNFIDETSSTNQQYNGEISSIADISSSDTVNVNTLTNLESEAVILKMRAGKTLLDAKKEVLTQILDKLGVTPEQRDSVIRVGANKIKLMDSTKAGTVLLSVSSSLMKVAKNNLNTNGTPINTFMTDMKDDIRDNKTTLQAKCDSLKGREVEVKQQITEMKNRIRAAKSIVRN